MGCASRERKVDGSLDFVFDFCSQFGENQAKRSMFKVLVSLLVASTVAFTPGARIGARSLKMTATAADVVSETTLATMARDARGLAIDSISAVSNSF